MRARPMDHRDRHRPGSDAAAATFSGRMLLAGWALALGVGTLVVVASSVQSGVLTAMQQGERPTFAQLVLWPAVYWSGWAMLAPFVFLVVRRAFVPEASWARAFAVLPAGMVLFFGVHVAFQVATMYVPPFDDIHPHLADAVSYHVTHSIYPNLVTYWVLVGVTCALTYYRRYRQREVEAARLESELVRAQLQALKMQLHPHFLFNTLHSISALMYRDVRAADRMVGYLGDLLRLVIEREAEQEVPLCDEVAFLEKYLQIERMRFADRLSVVVDVAPGVEQALVPNLVLQPLVENALKHGIGARPTPGRLEVRAWRAGERLRLRVSDDGPGLAATDVQRGLGIGLANTRARLDRLYGSDAELSLRPGEPAGLVVDLTLPYRTGREDGRMGNG